MGALPPQICENKKKEFSSSLETAKATDADGDFSSRAEWWEARNTRVRTIPNQ